MTNLLRFAIERTLRGVTPSQAITAPLPDLTPQDPDKGLLEQRELYFEQSRNTRDGEVASYPKAA